MSWFQVLCPKCDMGTTQQKSRCKKAKDAAQLGKKSPTKLESLCDVEKALSESRDSASAVSEAVGCDFFFVLMTMVPLLTVWKIEILNKDFNLNR